MNHHFFRYRRLLHNTGIWSQISPEYGDSPFFQKRMVDRTDHRFVKVLNPLQILLYGFSCHGQKICDKQILLCQLFHHRIHAACFLQIFHIGRTRRRQVTKIGRAVGNLIGRLHIDFHPRLMCDGRQMKHRIRGTAQRHIYGHGIHERILCHDISGADILLNQFHNLISGMLG